MRAVYKMVMNIIGATEALHSCPKILVTPLKMFLLVLEVIL
jgi:hypothetical protein